MIELNIDATIPDIYEIQWEAEINHSDLCNYDKPASIRLTLHRVTEWDIEDGTATARGKFPENRAVISDLDQPLTLVCQELGIDFYLVAKTGKVIAFHPEWNKNSLSDLITALQDMTALALNDPSNVTDRPGSQEGRVVSNSWPIG